VNCGSAESRTELTAKRWYSAARPSERLFGSGVGVQESLVRANRLPLSWEDRPSPSTYVALTDLAAIAARSAAQSGRDKEVDVGATLTSRDGFRLKARHAGLLALLLTLALGGTHAGASWGASAYDPTSDAYSMQNITAADGAQAFWNAGD